MQFNSSFYPTPLFSPLFSCGNRRGLFYIFVDMTDRIPEGSSCSLVGAADRPAEPSAPLYWNRRHRTRIDHVWRPRRRGSTLPP